MGSKLPPGTRFLYFYDGKPHNFGNDPFHPVYLFAKINEFGQMVCDSEGAGYTRGLIYGWSPDQDSGWYVYNDETIEVELEPGL